MNFEAVIGLEIHVQMKTKAKMFSAAPNGFSRTPNTQIVPLDMAFPGTMPTVNKQVVINSIRVANALHMDIDQRVVFDRKNYFYSDLPKGFQITQQYYPIGRDGYIEIELEDGTIKQIGIERIHMEEDTCKQEHFMDYTLLDYNRAGTPLIEIVSHPTIKNGYEAMKYVEGIRNIVVYSGTSDGKMEEGSMRCDVNVSIKPVGQEKFGTKVEIKNINSTKHIQMAIDYEIERQSKILLSGGQIQQETRRFDESANKTILMRLKSDAVDYKYFCEPNIAPINLSDEFVNNAINTCPELFDAKKSRYLDAGLTSVDAEIILADPNMADYFDGAMNLVKDPKILANFMITEINAYLNKQGIDITGLSLEPSALAEIINYQEKEGFSHKQCVDILYKALDDDMTPTEAKKALGIVAQIKDEDTILKFVSDVLDANPQSIEDYKNGKDRAIGFLIGQVMKQSRGKLNPKEVNRVMREEIAKR